MTSVVLALFGCSLLLALVAFLTYATVRYVPIISRIFEEKPMFLPLRPDPRPGGEDVRFPAADGIELAGTYFRARTASRRSVIVFCHEFLGNRWSFAPYVDHLRDEGFDLFTFDFRAHGESESSPGYHPLQWVTKHEVRDLQAALAYLARRPDRDPAGFGLFGVSRGGSAALCVTARDPRVWGVATDGAFPTHGTMLVYIRKWAEIYVSNDSVWRHLPPWVFSFLAWMGRVRSQRRLGCRYADVEGAVRRISPRPWLMIHGAKDAYIAPEIAETLFGLAGEPRSQWIVPQAKHNRSREVEPAAYAERIAEFFRSSAPRLAPSAELAPQAPPEESPSTARSTLRSGPVLAAPGSA